jgi:hypothetical protein
MQAPRGREVLLLLILDIGTRSGERSSSPDCDFIPGKVPPVPTGQEARWASELVWILGLKEKSFASAGDRTPFVQSVVRRYTA